MKKKKMVKSPTVIKSLDTDIKKSQINSGSIMASNIMHNNTIRTSIKNNPLMNGFGTVPKEAIDNFLDALAETFNAANAMAPEILTEYTRSTVKKSAHHAANAGRHMISASSKVIDNIEQTIKSL